MDSVVLLLLTLAIIILWGKYKQTHGPFVDGSYAPSAEMVACESKSDYFWDTPCTLPYKVVDVDVDIDVS